MTRVLIVQSIGPAVGLQDLGRPGFIASGLTRGGAIDRLAMYEGAALLRQSPTCAALEIAGVGGTFEATTPTRIALTGADMTARIDGTAAAWNASHMLHTGQRLTIGAARDGSFGYLHVGGGFDVAPQMGGRGAHLSAGLGRLVAQGDRLAIGPDSDTRSGDTLPRDTRFSGGTVRVVPSFQTRMFSDAERKRFANTAFRRDPRANRQGTRMQHDEAGFAATGQRTIVSDVIIQGDIQITGDGTPFVLMCESQTTGGYPRIGTVIPSDMPRIAQAPAGASVSFSFVTLSEAARIEAAAAKHRDSLRTRLTPLLRDPHQMNDLMSYQLVGGAISANADPFEQG